MKKLLTAMTALAMTLGILAGCGGNPVLDDLNNFVSVEMTAPMAKMEEMIAETDKWSDPDFTIEDAQQGLEKIIPICDEALQLAEGITTSTDEVAALKNGFVDSLKKYKEGYTLMLDGLKGEDDAKFQEGLAISEEGTAALNQFNADMKALASENGLEIE